MNYRADFHIHSCLSPCASLEMSPKDIVLTAQTAGLNALALSDHNCGFNLQAFADVCARHGMACLYGAEVTSSEEAHMLCLFDDLEAAQSFGQLIYNSLPPVINKPERFGDQPIITADNEILGFADKFLISASTYCIRSLLELVHSLGGLFIPAHIDRSMFGIISQLGFLPDEDFDAVELTARGNPNLAGRYPIIRNSDSHDLNSLGSASTHFELEALTVKNIRNYLWRQAT